MVNDRGLQLSPRTRRFTCPTNATYRRLSLTIATEMAKAFSAAPGVIGWQIDNEFTLGESGRCYCRFCRDGFQQWLRQKYGSLEVLNQAWGTVFWSNIYTGFSQIPVPLPSGAPPNPAHALDYDRYQSFAYVSFLREQLTMLRKQCPGHFITTNNVGAVDTLNMRDLYRDLDFVAADNYPGFFAIFAAGSGSGASIPSEALARQGWPALFLPPARAHPGFAEIRDTIRDLKSLGQDALTVPHPCRALCDRVGLLTLGMS
jgi:beta-galactosidase